MEKSWIKSKTLWINTLAIIGGVTTLLAGEMAAGTVLTLGGFINIILILFL